MTGQKTEKLFSACNISKSFPAVQALRNVDFDLLQGEVHALIGENGAGKSTLAGIVAGIAKPDAGEMKLLGEDYRPAKKTDAESRGVRIVMQELNLIENLSIAENIFIENIPSRFGFVQYKKLNTNAQEIMKKVGLGDIDPAMPVKNLGVGRRQMVEIAAGLSKTCRILALDEPTASLTDIEIELLFAQIEKLKSRRVGIIYISHRIEEVMRIADRVSILRDGRMVATEKTANLDTKKIIRMMVGRDIEHIRPGKRKITGKPALRAVSIRSGEKVRNINLEVRHGEILGIAGLMGSGRTEAMRAIFAADPIETGSIFLEDQKEPAKIRSPRQAVKNGIALITEDRKNQGLLMDLPVRVNISLTKISSLAKFGWINRKKERAVADRYIHELSVKCYSAEQKVRELSGGNQQKIVIAKWLFRSPKILIFDEPTRGIDVAAKFEIYKMLENLAQEGKAIIFVSSDLKELMAICDRISVISAGIVTETLEPNQWSREKIMAAALKEYIGA